MFAKRFTSLSVGNANMAKTNERSLSTIIASGTRSSPEVKLCRASRVLGRVERNSQLLKVDRFLFGNTNMGKTYERSLSTIIAKGKVGLVRSPKSNSVGRGEYLEG